MASWFTRAIDRITPWDRGGEVQRRQEERRRREEEEAYRRANIPRPTTYAPNQNQNVQNQRPEPQKPVNLFEDLNKNLVFNKPKTVVPVVNNQDVQPAPKPGEVVKPQQGLLDKVRDQIDANTQADKYRRQEGNRIKGENKPITLDRPGNIISKIPVVGHVVKGINTLRNQDREFRETMRGVVASRTNNPEAFSASVKRQDELRKNYMKNKGGLFNVGTLYDEEGAKRGDIETGAKDILAPSAVSVLDLYTLGKGSAIEQGIKQAGLRSGIRNQLGNIGKAALGNYGSGDLNVRAQGGTNEEAVKSGLINSVLGLAPDILLPALGKSIRNRIIPKIFKGQGVGAKDVVEELDDAAISASAEGAIQATRPRPISVQQNIPVDEVVGDSFDVPVQVRTPKKPQGPIIRELEGDAKNATQDSVVAKRVADIRRAEAETMNNVPTDRRIEGVTPRKPEQPFVLNKEAVARGQDGLIDDYADMIRNMGEGNGTQLVPDGEGGYFRSTNNIRFGDTKGKRMSKGAWRDEAERQLRNGEAEPGIQEAFDEAADPEVQALLTRGERPDVPEGNPIKVKQANTIDVIDNTDVPQNLPETPGTVRVTEATAPSNAKSEVVATQLPPISKAGTVMPDGTKVTKRMVQAEKNQRKLDKKYAKRQVASESTPVSPDTGRVTVYTDPNTGQNITKTYDDLIDDLSEINAIPKANRTVAQTARRKDIINTLEDWDEKSVPGKAPTVDERFPDMAPEARGGVKNVIDQLENANLANKDLKSIRTQERADRIAAGNRAYEEAGGGVAGMRAKTAALSGKLSKSSYEPVKVSDVAQKEILDDIQGSEIRPYEKLNTQRAFEKMWGSVDEKPTAGDIKKIRSYYNSKDPGTGDDVAELLQKAIDNDGDFSLAEQLLGAPRTAMTTGDLGAARQAGVLAVRHPVEGTKAFINGIINAFRPGRYADKFAEIGKEVDVNGTNYAEFMESMMNLNLPSTTGGLAEEAMSSAPLLEKIPIYGQIVKGSNRNFSGTLTDLRYNVAKNWIDANGGVDGALKKFSAKEIEDMGEALNTLSGRGGKRGGFTEKHAQILSNTLFSGRLWASRLNILNPYWYYRLSVPARKEALSSAAAFTATAGTILALANQQDGVEVEMDPRSADWGKIKIGNTRYDILGGLQQNIRVASQVLTGKKINSDTGEMKDTTIASAIGSFAEGKLSPVLGLALKLANSSDMEDNDNPLMRTGEWGEDLNIATETGKLGVPLPISGIKDTVEDTGSVGKGIAMNIPGFFGTGVQTYGKVPTKDANYDKNKSLQDTGKQLQAEGIETTVDKIDDLAQAGDYDNAVRAAEYRLGTLEVDKKATEQSRTEARQKLEDYKFGQKYGYIPTSQESVDKRAEDGDYDAAIAGWKHRLARDEAEGNTPKSKLNNQRNEIKRYEVYKKTDTTPDMVIAYEKDTSKDGGVGVTAWRDMMDSGDPKLVAYAEKLEKLDQTLVDKGIAKTAKYYWLNGRRGGGGRGGRGGSGSRNIDTSFGTLKTAGFAPRAKQYSTIEAKAGNVPIIRRVRPNIVHKISSSG